MNALLETGISLVFIFFIFSIITYVIQELIAINLKYRSKMLWKSMAQLFDGLQMPGRVKLVQGMPAKQTPATETFYGHAQIRSLQKNLLNRPGYIPAANFALAVMDIVSGKAAVKQNKLFEDFQEGLKTFVNSNGNLYPVLKNLADTSVNVKELQQKIEDWFNSYMGRVTGWYQSQTVTTLRLIAIAVTLFFNINVVRIAKKVYKDEQLRGSLVAMSEKALEHPESYSPYYARSFDQQTAQVESSYARKLSDSSLTDQDRQRLMQEKGDSLDSMTKHYTEKQMTAMKSLTGDVKIAGLPIGWSSAAWQDFINGGKGVDGKLVNIFYALVGWIIAACCISMGAPFWFDMLGKLVNVRRSGVKPTEPKENKS
jgi:hypothetical protein